MEAARARRWIWLLAVAGIALVLMTRACFLSFGVRGEPEKVTVSCADGWSVVQSPSPFTTNSLEDVEAVSATDVWAVGSSRLGSGRQPIPEGPGDLRPGPPPIQHWDGTTWKEVPSPKLIGSLTALSASRSDDVWAVGMQEGTGTGPSHALIEHWDGQGWSATSWDAFADVDAVPDVADISASNAWAIASQHANVGTTTVYVHWDGQHWSRVEGPDIIDGTDRAELSAVGPDDVWALGRNAVAHWNGRRWAPAAMPDIARAVLAGVLAVGPDDVWVLGDTSKPAPNASSFTLTVHWDGHSFTQVPSPTLAHIPDRLADDYLTNATAASPSDIWAIGQHFSGHGSFPLFEHWDGARWRLSKGCRLGPGGAEIRGVSMLPTGQVWAVGFYDRGSNPTRQDTLILKRA